VFGARGAASFLTKATKWLAITFFVLSLGIGMFITHGLGGKPQADVGVMGAVPAAEVPAVPPATGDVPAAPAPPAAGVPSGDVPAAPANAAPSDAAPAQPAPAEQPKSGGNG
jgi:preprotein translocase subunit SecG